MKIDSIFNKLYFTIGVPWLFLMLFTSGSLTIVKTILLILLILISTIEIVIRRLSIPRNYIIYTNIFIAYMVFSLMYGILSGYDFELDTDFSLLQYFIITPLFIVILTTVMSQSSQRKNNIFKIIILFTFLLAATDVIKDVTNITGRNIGVLDFIEVSSERIEEGKLALRLKNETSFFFLLPISIYLVFNIHSIKIRRICIATTIFGIIYAILSGRKVLEVEIIITFLLA